MISINNGGRSFLQCLWSQNPLWSPTGDIKENKDPNSHPSVCLSLSLSETHTYKGAERIKNIPISSNERKPYKCIGTTKHEGHTRAATHKDGFQKAVLMYGHKDLYGSRARSLPNQLSHTIDGTMWHGHWQQMSKTLITITWLWNLLDQADDQRSCI